MGVQVHCTTRGPLDASGNDGCPQMLVPTEAGLATVDREAFVAAAFGITYADRWSSVGYIALWVLLLQGGYVLAAAQVKRTSR